MVIKLKAITTILLLAVSMTAAAANIVWFDGTNPISYQVAGKTDPVVTMALQMWSGDMEQVTGLRPVSSKKAVIRIVQAKGKDDGFRISAKNGQILVEGHNGRGTAYGLLELSRMAGVSPWVWWGDVAPEHRDCLVFDETTQIDHTPSVAYRGIFINDEDWSLRRWSPDKMGPQTYKAVFQLLLRLRANTVWPAMHEGTPGFFTVKGNKEMADSCGILIGTSHCEPLLRNNVAEWDRTKRGAYNYITNREQVQQYWIERLQQVKGSEELFTIGMRGIHDGSMEGVKTKEEKLDGLQQVIDDQRELIRKYYDKHVEQVPQVFIPYKEVLEIMESGLRVPDDVTLMWCDDNYGYMTRLSDTEQQKRTGGGGVYYHLSYWGRPHDYLWLTTTQPGLIYSEMKAAYDHNCRKLWIANVHDPKVAAYDLELFLDMAWDMDALNASTLYLHLERWLCTQFGSMVGKAIAPAMKEFYRLCAIRKPEFMGWTQVELDKKKFPGGKSRVASIGMSRQEAAERLKAFGHLKAAVEKCRLLVRPELADAYEAHVTYPIYAAAAMTRKIVSDPATSHLAYEEIADLTRRYNRLAKGKWNGLMDAAPRQLPVFEEVCGQLYDDEPFDGIACNASDYAAAASSQLPAPTIIQMLGHSMNAVSIPKGGELVYHFSTQKEGDAMLYTAMIPTQPNDKGDLRYQVRLDEQPPVTISLKEPYRSERWKQNVLRGQALKETPVKVAKGQHTLRIKALDNHIIIDQWMLDFSPNRQFYVIPAGNDKAATTTTSRAESKREKLNFNADWRLCVGDVSEASDPKFDDSQWISITLPYAFNGNEAFKKDIVDLTDTICWYRKTFRVKDIAFKDKKYFVEFEGVRQGADFYLNGHHLGFSENGVMACGFDITSYIKEGENVLAVRCDNSWNYRSRKYNSRYQWNDRNFNANYGGIPKNVFLHITNKLYQTLPLYSNLGTTGTYVYATDFDIKGKKAMIHAESQVRNEDTNAQTFSLRAHVLDADGKEVAQFQSEPITIQPGETRIVKAQQEASGLHFWSWGYGYLYTVKTELVADGKNVDCVTTRTGFRKTRFAEGKIWLNDRVLMVHGYAQRTSNEWPGVGISVPAWLSDYSNGLMVQSGGNLVRWMHVTPWKQDIESCDRVGLIQAMPAGDAEKDVEGPRWAQRTELMRDAIIYNRNNPSILFYEGGNESISREHMLELKAIRDEYDPYGGRAIGSREMLDINEAEYGGEMLYINKSKKHPMWAMEYCRDEGLRKYWDEYSYPYHKEGYGPLYRGKPANDYNHNMDNFAVEMVRRWYDYWLERPGTGTRVSSGGVKIVFSDTNTHHRGESNYRTSGVTDAMRIPKDAFYVHQVMWNGWVDDEQAKTYIVGHWNYPANTVKPVYVVSTADEVELFLNGKSLGKGHRDYHYLHTFDHVHYEPGTLEAVASDGSRYKLETAGEPYQLKLIAIGNPEGTKADGADMVLFQVEVLDNQGRRCPLDNRLIHFELWGEGKWIGGIATGNIADNYIGAMNLPVECGVNRVLVRTTPNAGVISLSAYAEGVKPAYIEVKSISAKGQDALPQLTLKSRLNRGETPSTPSYTEKYQSIKILSAKAGFDSEHATYSFDDNELSEWKNDGRLSNAWITYKFEKKTVVDDICLKLTGWRLRSYLLEIYAGKQLIWSGETKRSLGYIHLKPIRQVKTNEITIRLKGAGKDKDAFGGIVEVAEPAAGELDLFKARNGGDTKSELRIVEVEFLERLQQ